MRTQRLNYFDEFLKIAKIIEKSTNILNNLIKNYNKNNVEKSAKEIHILEHESDDIVHTIRQFLVTDFLPPIDRVDIAELLHKLDNIEDGLDELVINFKILNVENINNKQLGKYSVLIEKASKQLLEILNSFSNLKNKKQIIEETKKMSKIEEEADRCFENLIETLYKESKDAIDIIKWTKLYNEFEYLFDTYENIADSIEDIIVKNS